MDALLNSKLLCGHTGIGDAVVWQGFPDALVNSSLTICSWNDRTNGEFEYHSEFEHASDSDDSENRMVSSITTVEAKTDPFLNQLVAQCVVNSFTERNTTGESRLQPVVLINSMNYRVCFYNCTTDLLLLPATKNLSTKGTLSTSGMFFLWLIFNHRYVYKC